MHVLGACILHMHVHMHTHTICAYRSARGADGVQRRRRRYGTRAGTVVVVVAFCRRAFSRLAPSRRLGAAATLFQKEYFINRIVIE
jgi:hypothetical protein